jgi:hypothetical protein
MLRITAALYLLILASCAGSSRYMVLDETPDSAVPAPGEAMIIFVRPSGMASGQSFTVLDGGGNFIGQLPSKGHVKHSTPPGHYRFLIWAENTETMEADVAADKTYYVEVATRMGWWSSRSHLFPVKQGTSEWDDVLEWVADTREWDRAPEATAEWVAAKQSGIESQLQEAEETWAGYDDEEKERRTLQVTDAR